VIPAIWPREEPALGRLLAFDVESGDLEDRRMDALPHLLFRGDLLVVNDAATLPASLQGTTANGDSIEVRLAGRGDDDREWAAALLGRGDWRTRTEERPLPPPVAAGDVLRFGEDLAARVLRVSTLSPRLVDVTFDREGARFWEALYRRGRPIQYSHLKGPLALWHVQTSYGARPWAVEAPSAGLPLTWQLLSDLRERGIALASITHAAGLSSIGDASVDAVLPLPERYDIPAATVEAIERAHRERGRVIAVGTTVVRALEGSAAAHGGRLKAGPGITGLRIDAAFALRVVDGLLTGLHEPGTSHFALLSAFAREDRLKQIWIHAEETGYLGHEFGDSMLILRQAPGVLGLQDVGATELAPACARANRRFAEGGTAAPRSLA